MSKEVKIQDMWFKYDDSSNHVFHPHPISLMMANKISVKNDDVVLDLCTGSGIFAIMAAKLGAKKVIAVDISSHALQTAKNNAELNGLDCYRIEFIESDYFSKIPNTRFDKIYSNPPCMPVCEDCLNTNEYFKLAVDGGSDGSIFYRKVIEESLLYLQEDGELMIPIPKWCNWRSIIVSLERWYTYEVVDEQPVRFYLIDRDIRLKKHIEDLYRDKVVDIRIIDNEICADVLICKCTPISIR